MPSRNAHQQQQHRQLGGFVTSIVTVVCVLTAYFTVRCLITVHMSSMYGGGRGLGCAKNITATINLIDGGGSSTANLVAISKTFTGENSSWWSTAVASGDATKVYVDLNTVHTSSPPNCFVKVQCPFFMESYNNNNNKAAKTPPLADYKNL